MDKRIALLFQMGILLSLILVFCPPGYSEPTNITLAKIEAIKYHDSGRYEQELTQTIQQAQRYILEKARTNQHSKHPQKLALVLDIDETSISNYDKMAQRDFAPNKAQIHKEILAANSPAIKPLLTLYRKAMEHGVSVFFVTGRNDSERYATVKNLKNVGYAHWAGIYFKPQNYAKSSARPFKSGIRAQISQKGYLIIASIGDQYSDIEGGHALKGFKLPNPYYYLP